MKKKIIPLELNNSERAHELIPNHKVSGEEANKRENSREVDLVSVLEERTRELSKANEKLSELISQKDFLISIISHDLMGYFFTLYNISNSLAISPIGDNKQNFKVNLLQRASEKGYLLLENILSWSRSQLYNIKTSNPLEKPDVIVGYLLELMQKDIKDKALEIEFDFQVKTPVDCDTYSFMVIMKNLINNAIKFSHQEGSIVIGSRHIADSDKKIAFFVRDHGEGIDLNTRQLFLTTYDTIKNAELETHQRLGLLIVNELVKNNNGQVYFQKNESPGTEIVFEFNKLEDREKSKS